MWTMEQDRPELRCFVAFPIAGDVFSDPALVSLETAADLRAKGYLVVGPDPQDEIDLATWERAQRVKHGAKWFERG